MKSMSTVIWFLTITCLTWPVSMFSVAQQQPDITLLTLYDKDPKNMTLTCVGGSNTYNSALTFITPLEPKYAKITPKSIYKNHIGTVIKGNFNCEFENMLKCAKLWEEFEPRVKEYGKIYIAPVIDERWEKFTINYTDNDELKQISHEANQEHLAISVRSESNVRIHLCDGANDQSESMDCYVIIIPDNKQPPHSFRIQQCNNVMGTKYDATESKCTNSKTGEGGSLMDGLWGHYTITAESGKNNIKVFKLGQEKTGLEYSGLSTSISKIFISSNAGAFWKIHRYKYLQLNFTDRYETIGLPFQALSTGRVCLSLYVAVCSTCTLHIAINDELKTINGASHGQTKWQNVRLITNVLENQHYSLRIKGSKSGTEEFWAIDDIRECNVEESRSIAMEVLDNTNAENLLCQTLNFPDLKVSNNGNLPENLDMFFCKDIRYIGANCDIPCQSVDPLNDTYCNMHRICKPTNNGRETRCACALGYKGARCNEPCTNWTYGYDCQKKCGYCANNGHCGKSSGICYNGCENGYVGQLCTTLLYPILKEPPTFVSSTLTNITVRLDNTDTKGQQSANKFQLQYTIHTKGPWINYSKPQTLDKSAIVTVENLDSETNYGIRAILFTVNNNSYNGSQVPYITSFTNCKGVSENTDGITDITFRSTANSIYIQWKPVCKIHLEMSLMCRESWCKMQPVNNTILSTTRNYTFTELLPYTSYEIHVSSGNKQFVSKKIKTNASVPPAVRDLTVYSRDAVYLALRWKAPFPPHGELESYQLTYRKCDLPNGHSVVITKPTLCNLWDNFLYYRIIDVEGYQCYRVLIRAKNINVTNYNSDSWIDTHTRQDRSQAPRNLRATWNNEDELTLNWTHPLVTNGDLKSFDIIFVSNDTNPYKFIETYSVKDEKRFYIYKIQKSIHLSTTYNLSIYGKNNYAGEVTSITIITPPATPALIGNITAGKRTNTTQVINIPSADITTTDTGDMYVVVCDPNEQSFNTSARIPYNCTKNITRQTNCSGTAWIAVILSVNATGTRVTVGDNTTTNTTARNKPLHPNVTYQVSVVLVNYYNRDCRYKVYTLTKLIPIFIPEEYHSNPALYALLLLLLLPVIAWFIYRCILRSKHGTIANDQQNFILSQLRMAPKENSPIKESDTITQPLLQNIVNGEIKEYSRVVQIGNLADYVKKSMENGELKNQHQLFPKGQTKPWDYGMLIENKSKNRYANLSAYDETRVVLGKIHGDPHSDFINANYIDGYQQTRAYIATQGPKLTTVNDFWRMIWQENVSCIVMLANLVESNKKKCEQYWPEKGNTRTFQNIVVTFNSSEIYADFEYRTFLAQRGEETRQIQQLHFTSWPDHGVPLYPQTLVPFVKKLLTFSTKHQPIVVHCSAGVGRTGTIILCDICLRMAANEKAIDVLYYLKKIRDQRANLVDNVSQYNLVHMVLLECLTAPDTSISCQNLPAKVDQWIIEKEIQKQMAYLQNTAWYYSMMAGKITDGNVKANASKNRCTHVIPETKRIYLTRYPVQDEHSDYINAVPVDGFRFKEQFIATQTPLPQTVGDFWRMVDEQNVGVILSLNAININDQTSCTFWPCDHGVLNPVPYLNVKYISAIRETLYDKYTVQLEHKNPKETQNEKSVTIIQLKGWKREQVVPSNVNVLLSLLSETETYFRRNTPIVISCYDGYTASGLFLALSFTIEKIKLEKAVDVCMAVREIRKNRTQFVNDERQFQFLYQAAVAYVHSFEIYSNFQ